MKGYDKKWTIDLFGGFYDGVQYKGFIRGRGPRFVLKMDEHSICSVNYLWMWIDEESLHAEAEVKCCRSGRCRQCKLRKRFFGAKIYTR